MNISRCKMIICKRLVRLFHVFGRNLHLLVCVLVLFIAPSLVIGQTSGTIKVEQPKKPAQPITATIADKSGGAIHKSHILSEEIIKVNDTITVIMYEFHLNQAAVKTNFTVEGNQLNNEVKRYIDKLRTGQIIRFKNILCRDKNGLTFRVSDMQFEIINSK